MQLQDRDKAAVNYFTDFVVNIYPEKTSQNICLHNPTYFSDSVFETLARSVSVPSVEKKKKKRNSTLKSQLTAIASGFLDFQIRSIPFQQSYPFFFSLFPTSSSLCSHRSTTDFYDRTRCCRFRLIYRFRWPRIVHKQSVPHRCTFSSVFPAIHLVFGFVRCSKVPLRAAHYWVGR